MKAIKRLLKKLRNSRIYGYLRHVNTKLNRIGISPAVFYIFIVLITVGIILALSPIKIMYRVCEAPNVTMELISGNGVLEIKVLNLTVKPFIAMYRGLGYVNVSIKVISYDRGRALTFHVASMRVPVGIMVRNRDYVTNITGIPMEIVFEIEELHLPVHSTISWSEGDKMVFKYITYAIDSTVIAIPRYRDIVIRVNTSKPIEFKGHFCDSNGSCISVYKWCSKRVCEWSIEREHGYITSMNAYAVYSCNGIKQSTDLITFRDFIELDENRELVFSAFAVSSIALLLIDFSYKRFRRSP